MAVERRSCKDIEPIKPSGWGRHKVALYVAVDKSPDFIMEELSNLREGKGYGERYDISQIDSSYLYTESGLKRKLDQSKDEMLHRTVYFEFKGKESGMLIGFEIGEDYTVEEGFSASTFAMSGAQSLKTESSDLKKETVTVTDASGKEYGTYLDDQLRFLKRLAKQC